MELGNLENHQDLERKHLDMNNK